MPFDVAAIVKSVTGPASLGVLLSIALVVRLLVGDGRAARGWSLGLAWVGFAVYLAWQLAILFVLPPANMDLNVFYRAGREADAGLDPYRFTGEMVFLSPPPALGAFRLVSRLPLPWVGAAWTIANAAMTLALVPLSNRLLARDHAENSEAPPPLPGDLSALLSAALANSNASIWGQRSGQLCASTAFCLILALLLARQRPPRSSGSWLAGACLALAAFKPATVIPFLLVFLRWIDWRVWLGLAAVSTGLALAAAPPTAWPTLVAHNLDQIKASGAIGKINDYSYERDISADIIAFNHLFHRLGLRDRALISTLQALATLGVLGAIFAVRRRGAFGATAALAALGSLLVLYHRMYDAVVLALPLTVFASYARIAPGRRRRVPAVVAVVLLLGVIDGPREALMALTRWSLTQGPLGRVVQAVGLPYATWSLVVVLIGGVIHQRMQAPQRDKISSIRQG